MISALGVCVCRSRVGVLQRTLGRFTHFLLYIFCSVLKKPFTSFLGKLYFFLILSVSVKHHVKSLVFHLWVLSKILKYFIVHCCFAGPQDKQAKIVRFKIETAGFTIVLS